VTPKPD